MAAGFGEGDGWLELADGLGRGVVVAVVVSGSGAGASRHPERY